MKLLLHAVRQAKVKFEKKLREIVKNDQRVSLDFLRSKPARKNCGRESWDTHRWQRNGRHS